MPDTALVVALIELLLVKGPSAFINIMKSLDNDNPTLEQIELLKVKMPEAYEGD